MNIKELLDINATVFGVRNPKIRALQSKKMMASNLFSNYTSLDIRTNSFAYNNSENIFVYTGKKRCLAFLKVGLELIIFVFDDYFSLLEYTNKPDSNVVLDIYPADPFMQYDFTLYDENLFFEPQGKEAPYAYSLPLIDMKNGIQRLETSVSMRYYVLEYDNTKVMKI